MIECNFSSFSPFDGFLSTPDTETVLCSGTVFAYTEREMIRQLRLILVSKNKKKLSLIFILCPVANL
jgi:hypothetical protein